VPGDQVTSLWRKLFGRRGAPESPAEAWLSQRRDASPEEVLRQHFLAIQAHDLDWLLATMAPERARLYSDSRTLDRRRLSMAAAKLLAVDPDPGAAPLPSFASHYQSAAVYKVTFELELAPPEQRRLPNLQEGRQWAYYVLVNEGPGKPWLIADWGV
jgi:hypothetical protein